MCLLQAHYSHLRFLIINTLFIICLGEITCSWWMKWIQHILGRFQTLIHLDLTVREHQCDQCRSTSLPGTPSSPITPNRTKLASKSANSTTSSSSTIPRSNSDLAATAPLLSSTRTTPSTVVHHLLLRVQWKRIHALPNASLHWCNPPEWDLWSCLPVNHHLSQVHPVFETYCKLFLFPLVDF